MKLLDCINQGLFYLDGGTGTWLQRQGLQPGELPEIWNLRHPDRIIDLHRQYYEAGSHMICTNTFGANALKYDGQTPGLPSLQEVVTAAVACARQARDQAQGGQPWRFIALDIGPLGRLLAPSGDLGFEEAVRLFSQVVRLGAEAGAEAVLIETMNDAYETKAAVLAARESCSLPLMVSNVYDRQGRLLSGSTPEAMVALLEGLGADVLGMNCSLGPADMKQLFPRFASVASVPLLVKPNAGLPRIQEGQAVYDVTAPVFARDMLAMARQGARVLGGCCGTTPAYIRELVAVTAGSQATLPFRPTATTRPRVISSGQEACEMGARPILIGERINPTGKPRFKAALRQQDLAYIVREGLRQQEQGVQVLDVNVGLPEVDEVSLLPRCVQELQSVCDLPLQLDSSNPQALAAALRVYNGKAMINSVNGTVESMAALFPLVKKYGGLLVALTLDARGIPATAQGRLDIARHILHEALAAGLSAADLIFDPLAMAVSADAAAAQVTLDSISLIRQELGLPCLLGVSNVSFGLPHRELINAAFFTLALGRGLQAAILNPFSLEMQKAYHSYLALRGLDEHCLSYIRFAGKVPQTATDLPAAPQAAAAGASPTAGPPGTGTGDKPLAPAVRLRSAVIHGQAQDAGQAARQALAGTAPLELVQQVIIPALDQVGQGFEQHTLFLPQLMMSAEAARRAFDELRQVLPPSAGNGPRVILATVKGDIHDIGKNIVKAVMENYGFQILDLGRDVPPGQIVRTALQEKVRLVGLSALMTTTVPAMAETIRQLKAADPAIQVMVGGAVLTQAYADQIGADFYGRNAMESVRYAERVFGQSSQADAPPTV
ncbi:MAG: homocysteine S-methyltransferase family protein [Oscillospiraceae bacterium]|nr:homocysteine S-methyltransferase family protein [Oscillospiraceae bacterium]